MKELIDALTLGIKDYFKKNNFKKGIIGLSGGLDSSVAAFLVAKAVGNKNLTAVLMPDKEVTSQDSIKDAILVAKKLNIVHKTIEIQDFIKIFKQIEKNQTDYQLANSKARIRMTVLYFLANKDNSLVIGTSDKSEIALGYTTKYGDNASDISVLGDLWKTEVKQIGKLLGVPESVLKKAPSAELISGQTAEKELGAPYEILDQILKLYIEENLSKEEILKKDFDKDLVKNIVKRIKQNEHKRRTAMIMRVSDKSFHGMEWRMPVTNGFEG